MLRLAIQLLRQESDYRAAASRIRSVAVVDHLEAADAVVTDQFDAIVDNTPVLWVGRDTLPSGVGSKVFPAFPWRFEPRVLAIRQSLDAGHLGKPALMRLHVWSSAAAAQPLDDHMRITGIDLAQWLFGEQPNAVFRASHRIGLEIIHLGFPGGGMALLDFHAGLPKGDGYRSLTLIGPRGAAYADDHRDRNLLFAGGPPGASPPDTRRAFIQPMLEDFAAAVSAGHAATAAARDYQNAVNTLNRARQSRT